MPTYTAADIIGKTLYARRSIEKYSYPGGPVIGTIRNGETVGEVDSWVTKPGTNTVMWQIKQPGKAPFYVEHREGWYSFTKGTTKSQEEIIKDQIDQQQMDEKGKFIFYLEKYGKAIGTAILAFMVFREVLRNSSK